MNKKKNINKKNKKNNNFRKAFVLTATGMLFTFNVTNVAFAAEKPYTINNVQEYNLVNSYTLQHAPSSSGNAYLLNTVIKPGTPVDSPYVFDVQGVKASEGEIGRASCRERV